MAWTFCLVCHLINDGHWAKPFSLEKKSAFFYCCFLNARFYPHSLCGSWRCRFWFNTLSGDVLARSFSQGLGFHLFSVSSVVHLNAPRVNRFSIEPLLYLADNGTLTSLTGLYKKKVVCITHTYMQEVEDLKYVLVTHLSILRLIYCRGQNTSCNQQVFLVHLLHL